MHEVMLIITYGYGEKKLDMRYICKYIAERYLIINISPAKQCSTFIWIHEG